MEQEPQFGVFPSSGIVKASSRRKFLVALTASVPLLLLGGLGAFRITQGVLQRSRHKDFSPPDDTGYDYDVLWSHDLAYAALVYSSTGQEKIAIWDYEKQAIAATLQTGKIYRAAWSPDNRYIACENERSSKKETEIDIWSIQSQEKARTLRIAGDFNLSSWSWSPDGSAIAGADDTSLRIHDAVSGRLLMSEALVSGTSLKDAEVKDLSWSPDGAKIALLLQDFEHDLWSVSIWERKSNLITEIIKPADLGEDYDTPVPPTSVFAWAPSGKQLAVFFGASLWIIDLSNPSARYALDEQFDHYFKTASWSPDGKYLAAGNGNEIGIWNVAERSRAGHLNNWLGTNIDALYWTPDGQYLLSLDSEHKRDSWQWIEDL